MKKYLLCMATIGFAVVLCCNSKQNFGESDLPVIESAKDLSYWGIEKNGVIGVSYMFPNKFPSKEVLFFYEGKLQKMGFSILQSTSSLKESDRKWKFIDFGTPVAQLDAYWKNPNKKCIAWLSIFHKWDNANNSSDEQKVLFRFFLFRSKDSFERMHIENLHELEIYKSVDSSSQTEGKVYIIPKAINPIFRKIGGNVTIEYTYESAYPDQEIELFYSKCLEKRGFTLFKPKGAQWNTGKWRNGPFHGLGAHKKFISIALKDQFWIDSKKKILAWYNGQYFWEKNQKISRLQEVSFKIKKLDSLDQISEEEFVPFEIFLEDEFRKPHLR
jgi:hypothetical protein